MFIFRSKIDYTQFRDDFDSIIILCNIIIYSPSIMLFYLCYFLLFEYRM